jgi:hypothetical protein
MGRPIEWAAECTLIPTLTTVIFVIIHQDLALIFDSTFTTSVRAYQQFLDGVGNLGEAMSKKPFMGESPVEATSSYGVFGRMRMCSEPEVDDRVDDEEVESHRQERIAIAEERSHTIEPRNSGPTAEQSRSNPKRLGVRQCDRSLETSASGRDGPFAAVNISTRYSGGCSHFSNPCSTRRSVSRVKPLTSVKLPHALISLFLPKPSTSEMYCSTSADWRLYFSRRCCLRTSAVCFWRFFVPKLIADIGMIADVEYYAN